MQLNKQKSYYYQIDALRSTMLLLGIVIHAGLSLMEFPLDKMWPYKYSENSLFFDVLVLFIHTFRVPVFFVLAGFFMEMSLKKYSRVTLLIKKIKRIGIPLFFGTLLLYPIIEYAMLSANLGYHSIRKFIDYFEVSHYSFAHLWFLYYLFIFYIVHIIVSPSLCSIRDGMGKKYGWRLIWIPVVLVIFAILVLVYINRKGFDGDYTLIPNIGSVLYFIGFYILGFVVFNIKEWMVYLEKYFKIFFTIGGLLFSILLYSRSKVQIPGSDFSVFEILLYVPGAYLFVFGFFGLFGKLFTNRNIIITYISKSSYFIFVIHLPILILILSYIVNWHFNVYILFIVLILSTFIISYLLYFVLEYLKKRI